MRGVVREDAHGSDQNLTVFPSPNTHFENLVTINQPIKRLRHIWELLQLYLRMMKGLTLSSLIYLEYKRYFQGEDIGSPMRNVQTI